MAIEGINVFYNGLASITSMPSTSSNFYFSNSESLLLDYEGAGEDTDHLRIYEQEEVVWLEQQAVIEASSSSQDPHQTLFSSISIPGIYDIKLENSAGYVIKEEDVFVLDPSIRAIYASPEITHINDQIVVAFSGASLTDKIVLLKQNESNPETNNMVNKIVSDASLVGGEGHTTLTMPSVPGMYELHLLDAAYNSTGARPIFVTVIDLDVDGIYTQLNQIQNDEVRVVYHRPAHFVLLCGY